MNPEIYAYGLLLFPLASALLIACFFRRNGAMASGISVAASLLILATALHLIWADDLYANASWLELGPLSLDFGFLINDVAKLMLFVVAFVGFLIHVFSLGYMKDDPNKARFFGGLSIFMFSMLGIVVASSLATIFIFWELVGFSSYMLIGFYFDKPSASDAAKKAFIVNRVGDFGFLIGIVIVFWVFGTLDLEELSRSDSSAKDPALLTAIGLLLFCGTVGKSGQLPLHVWLPDAMEGPTPVSALIHAATMVAAGVYLLCRIGFLMTIDAAEAIAFVGILTALFAGLTAIGQRDIKKILAYSTVSQLGYMVAAFGLGTLVHLEAGGASDHAMISGGVAAAMFHLTTHGFFKALLFLGSGSVIHACHHEQDIFRMGGLMKRMPVTFWTFTIGLLALIGTPFFAGFFSKDAILVLAYQQNSYAFYALVFGAFLTAFYMIRLWKIAFLGQPNSDHAEHAKENGLTMTIPLALLAFGSLFGGFSWLYPEALKPIILAAERINKSEGHSVALGFGVIAWAFGLVLAFLFYGAGAKEDRFEKLASPLYRVFSAKFYFDSIYNWYVAKFQQRVATLLYGTERFVLSALIIKGFFGGAAAITSIGLRMLHVGNLHAYVYWFIGGLALFYVLAR